MVVTISGATGPNTARIGGYGRNAGTNVKQYFATPTATTPTPEAPKSDSFLDSLFGGLNADTLQTLIKLAQSFMAPGSTDPQELMKDMLKLMKGKFGGDKEMPDVQFIATANLGSDAKYDDTLGYASEMLNATSTPGSTPNNPAFPTLDPSILEEQKEKMKPMIDMIGGMFGDDVKKQMEEMFGNDPSKMFDELKDQLGVDMGDILPGGGAKKLGLADNVLDRNTDGKVDLAEKAAEALFMDDSIGLAKQTIDGQLADPMFAAENFEKAGEYQTLQSTLRTQSSSADGIITVAERKWAHTLADKAQTSGLVGDILDGIIVREDLRTKAELFEANDIL